jgi:hypothetical protein
VNLQPLYDVKERLESAAIAGTGLLSEDFRLQRAAEGLRPLAAASPVFAKIDGSLQSLLSAPAEERALLLLDVLALVDAVAYTQGSAGASGELAPLSPKGCGACLELSYIQLHPLLEAVTGSGGGRIGQIREIWEAHPEFFGDYRVLPVLVEHLDESYAELADLYVEILKRQGPSLLPLLREGFDPEGKREMARRVEVIAALSGEGAGAWLRDLLPKSKKDVRTAVITALGLDSENNGILLDLSRTERGRNREAVLEALARQDGEAVSAFWKEEIGKNADSVKYLALSGTDWASDLAAAAFRSQLEGLLAGDGQAAKETLALLDSCHAAISGKSSPAMLDCWRWIDGHLNALGKLKSASGAPHSKLGETLPAWLLESLCQTGPGPLCGLALELWSRHQDQARYLPHGMVASLLTRSAEEVFEAFSSYLVIHKTLMNNAREQIFNRAALEGLSRVFWNRERSRYEISYHTIYSRYVPVYSRCWPVLQPLDPRWYDLLTENPDMSGILRHLLRPDDPRICQKIGACVYKAVHDGGSASLWQDVAFLKECGWTEWKGLLSKRVKRDSAMNLYTVTRLLDETPLTGPEKAAELRALEEIVKAQSSSRPRWAPQQVQRQLDAWEKD